MMVSSNAYDTDIGRRGIVLDFKSVSARQVQDEVKTTELTSQRGTDSTPPGVSKVSYDTLLQRGPDVLSSEFDVALQSCT